jgi:cell wall-associated NlpC family hydrolase
MAESGRGLRRSLRTVAVLVAIATIAPMTWTTAADAAPPSWREGEEGSGPAPFPVARSRASRAMMPTSSWIDLESDDQWARAAIDHVAGANDWMRDVAPDQDGNWRFRPDALESRRLWARALVRAFAPEDEPDPSITFSDIDPTNPFHRAAAIAVGHGWMSRRSDGAFAPTDAVTARTVHRSLVRALGMGPTAAEISALSTSTGYAFETPPYFGVNMLAMRLGLRYNNKVDEAQDVTPLDHLRRKQAAWSLYRATTLESWVVPYLQDQYAGIVLPSMGPARRSIVDWGVRYVGYPYIWGGEWGFATPEPAALGGQPGPGFDCSGLSWWALRADDGGYWNISPPRPHEGWPLPQRTSAEMSRLTKQRLTYANLKPGDLMFYDGDGDGTVDHVDVFVGNGWSLDSSSSVGGVTLMWVKTGWYRQHFVHGRRILPAA